MKPFPLIVLILSLAGAAILGVLYYQAREQGEQLQRDLNASQQESKNLSSHLDQARKVNLAQKEQLNKLDADLGATKTALTTSRSKNVQLNRQVSQLKESVTVRQGEIRLLSAEVLALKETLAQARAHESSPESVAAYKATISELEQQLDSVKQAPPPTPAIPVLTTHRSRSSRVVSVGPSNAFVVLNYGAAHGALPTQKMTIRRGTKTLAVVQISDVRENYSIAQVRPDSLRDTLIKGDSATLAH